MGDKALVAFNYERLDGLRFNCSILGHETKLCPQKKNGDGQQKYSEWLKAGNKRRGEPSPSRKPPSTPWLDRSDDDEARVPPQPAGIADLRQNPSNVKVNENRGINGPNPVWLV